VQPSVSLDKVRRLERSRGGQAEGLQYRPLHSWLGVLEVGRLCPAVFQLAKAAKLHSIA
jgi:hypothetical protein